MKITHKRRLGLRWVIALIVLLALAASTYLLSRTNQPAEVVPIARGDSVTQEPRTIEDYQEFSEQPARLAIPSLGIDAAVEPLGFTDTGAMAAPENDDDVGWYRGSAQLGQDSDFSVLLDGHYGTDARKGVFYELHKIRVGEEMTLTGADGASAKYRVVELERLERAAVDMKKALYKYPNTRQSLTLITCHGEYDAAQNEYDDRIVVYAERVS